MVTAERPGTKRGRRAASPWLRVLAVLVAFVLSASALSQAAHFLLVPHAICAEHGELLELGERAAHDALQHDPAAHDSEPEASQTELPAEHDHCQLLARSQRELSLFQAASVALLPAACSVPAPIFADSRDLTRPQQRLALAPKTSPPRSPGC